MYLMMDIEISCKGHCESFSLFLYLVSYSEIAFIILSSNSGIFEIPDIISLISS